MSSTATERLTSTSLDLPPDLYGYAAMHLGMQRDAARLERTLAAGPRDAAALSRWWQQFRDVIVRHHVREDDLIWPALAAADETFAAEVAEMHDDHAELDAAMARLDHALSSLPLWEAMLDEARAAAASFRQVLADHLAREEEVAFHRLAARPQLWADLERRIDDQVRIREATFEFPWVLDGLHPTRAAHLWPRVPRLARPIVRRRWQPRYARLVTAAHAAEVTR
jgi:hemerythrin-like domain-containing protein